NERNRDSHVGQAARDLGNSACGLVVVHRDTHEPASRAREICHLKSGGCRIGGVGVRHRLNDDRIGGPYGNVADDGSRGLPSRYGGQLCLRVMNLKANSLAWAVHVTRKHPSLTLT